MLSIRNLLVTSLLACAVGCGLTPSDVAPETQVPDKAATAAPIDSVAAKEEILEPSRTKNTTYDPRLKLEPLPWPKYVTIKERNEIEELIAAIDTAGIQGIRAKKSLRLMGHKSLVGIVNALRDINYCDTNEVLLADELNTLLEGMTLGLNVSFRPAVIGKDPSRRDADWNGKTVKVWQKFVTHQVPTIERWEAFVSRRKPKSAQAR